MGKYSADEEELKPTPSEVAVDTFLGPAYGPGGDVYLSPKELRDQAKYGQYFPSGTKARLPDGSPMPFYFDPDADIPGLGRGGRGGGRAAAPKYGIGELESTSPERLRDRLIGYYEDITGAIPDRPSLDWVNNMALGNKSIFDIRAAVQATPEFRTRFKHMPAGMDINDYDRVTTAGHAEALEIAGRQMNDSEIELLFADDGDALYDSLMGEG